MACLAPVAPVTEANLALFERKLQPQAPRRASLEEDDRKSGCSGCVSAYTKGSLATTRSRPKSAIGSASYVPLSARDSRAPRPPSSRGYFARSTSIDGAHAPSSSSRPATGRRRGQANVDWSSFDKMAGRLYLKDLDCQRMRGRELQQKLKEDLDKQIADARLKQARARDEDRRLDELEPVAFGCWEGPQEEEKQRSKEKAEAVKKEIEAQIASLHVRKHAERQRLQTEAEQMVERLNKEYEQDVETTAQRRQLRRELAQKALAESSDDQAKRDEAERLRSSREEALVEEHYNKMIERDKRVREGVSQKAEKRRLTLEATIAERTLAEKEKQDETEGKAKAEQEAKDSNDRAVAEAKSEKMKKDRLANQDYIFEQMRLKKEMRQKEQEMKQTLGAEMEADVRKFKEAETTRMNAQRQRALDNRAELEMQIRRKMQTPSNRDAMSASEMKMNRVLVERLEKEDTERATQLRSSCSEHRS